VKDEPQTTARELSDSVLYPDVFVSTIETSYVVLTIGRISPSIVRGD